MKTKNFSTVYRSPLYTIYMLIAVALLMGIFSGCANVPKQSVELSATIGRDISKVHESHKNMARLLFSRMKQDINEFVDTKYAPFLINRQLTTDKQEFSAGDKLTLFGFLESSIQYPDSVEAQTNAIGAMEIIFQELKDSVEAFRNELLLPLLRQEERVIGAIDQSYYNIHYANSIVTGHLSSIIEVHDAQKEVLSQFGAEDLRDKIGKGLTEFCGKLQGLIVDAKKAETSIEEGKQKIKELIDKGIHGITKKSDSQDN
ncbi:MAG: hypothetical protein KAR42_04665 [candidate division Zixibacteria bacterium]|nr:hypothetical protein [candidate division Zixibacteria bacterium]